MASNTPYTPDINSDSADFIPSMGDYKTLQPFRYWCQKVLPLVYDDSLSYYELLCKVVDYLNKTMEDVETLHDDVDDLHTAYGQLQNFTNTSITDLRTDYQNLVSYVNNYFNTLDVQQEINNKLDAMALNGTLTTLMSPYIPNAVATWLSQHLTPTTPVVDNTLTISGGAADAKVTGDKISALEGDVDYLITDTKEITSSAFETGTYNSSGEPTANNNRIRTASKLPVQVGEKITITPGDTCNYFAFGFFDGSDVYQGTSTWWSTETEITITYQTGLYVIFKHDDAGNTPITPADYDASIVYNKELVIPDDSITPEKTTFMTPTYGENLFDFDTMTTEDEWYPSFTVGYAARTEPLAEQYHNTYIAFKMPLWKAEAFIMSCASTSNAQIYKAALIDKDDKVLSIVVNTHTLLREGIAISTVPEGSVAICGTIEYWKEQLVDLNVGIMACYGSVAKPYVEYTAPIWSADSVKADTAYDMALALQSSKRSVMYITSDIDDLDLFKEMYKAYLKGNVDVYFEKSTYTLQQAYLYMWNTLVWRWSNALPCGNGCRYFFNDSTIISNPPANPPEGSNAERSILDCRNTGTSFEVHDVTLINNGGRYCIHDEGNNSRTPYCHKYVNVTAIYNKTELTPDTGSKAFGCGTGFDASLLFDGCSFIHTNGQNTTRIAIHGPTTNPNHDASNVHLIMKNSYTDAGTIYVNNDSFESTSTLNFFLFGNKFGTAFSNAMVDVIENNNTVSN